APELGPLGPARQRVLDDGPAYDRRPAEDKDPHGGRHYPAVMGLPNSVLWSSHWEYVRLRCLGAWVGAWRAEGRDRRSEAGPSGRDHRAQEHDRRGVPQHRPDPLAHPSRGGPLPHPPPPPRDL